MGFLNLKTSTTFAYTSDRNVIDKLLMQSKTNMFLDSERNITEAKACSS